MKYGRHLIFLLAAAALAGCGSSPTPAASEPKETTPAAKGPAEPAEPKTEAPKPTLDSIPAGLKHDGFAYYGLGNPKPLKMKLMRAGTTVSGEQAFTLETVDKDSAVFKQEWTGNLPAADSKVKVTDKGIFGIEARGSTINPPQMELPASIKPGFTWKSDAKITVDGSTISGSSAKIVGIKAVKVGGKTIQALAVQRTSKVTTGGVTQNMATTEYYQKGVGAVKLEVTMSGGGQPTQSFSMEAEL